MRMDRIGASKENGDGNCGDAAGIQPMQRKGWQVRPSSDGGVAGGISHVHRHPPSHHHLRRPWPGTMGERANGRTGEWANGRTGSSGTTY